jgi:sugar lactone lactonase YvrE
LVRCELRRKFSLASWPDRTFGRRNCTCARFRVFACLKISDFDSIPGQGFGLAFDAAGNLFAADASDQTIFKFTPAGAPSVFVGPAAFTSVQFPVGPAFDRFGNLFVTTEGNEGSPGGDAILVFAPDGTESTFATDLSNPREIAFDPSGDLLVAELKLLPAPGDILKFSTNAKRSSLLASGSPRVMVVRSS